MRSKIDDVTSRLKALCRQRTKLGLVEIAGVRSTALVETRDTTCLPTEAVVYGRDQDKANILEMVLRDEPGDANFDVIPIVGMGGIGKTTLIQKVYNDDAVKDFDPKAWVCVSEDFDVLQISNAIIRSITLLPSDYKDLNSVHVKLKELLNGKKFLLVLDDVWSNDDKSWQTLRSPFLFGVLGSKVIVTTRLQEVALTMRPRGGHYKLDCLSDDDCWSLFMKFAFAGKDDVADWNLEEIRRKVVQNCKGLPLAARTLGGVLHRKDTEDEWIDILNSKIWDQPGADNVLPVLKLSYNHLPSYLKRCFTYCAIFPKDYEFEMEELVLLWMAEGLIQQSTGDNKQLEKLGGQYFLNLLSRSIFQISSSNNSKHIMHDLVNDLAQTVYEKVSFRSDDELYSNNQSRISEKTVMLLTYVVVTITKVILKSSVKLRT
ncbi:hypothetical protein LWI28_006768 [Acer negundo]|uniref:Disease resistance RPP13-like protein 1 n=1 Tax=Acer negundo TaxID=4023 RepID=A0AAD5NX34_ACENE|nr:hypothetical protein LWI28_006768 [Acer negundo]